MRIPIDSTSSVPIYQQIETYLRGVIVSDVIADGTRLPAARQLAAELGVSRTTVETAYERLEALALVERRVGSGTFSRKDGGYRLGKEPDSTKPAWPEWQRTVVEAKGDLLDRENERKRDAGRASRIDMISFAGVGDPRRFPIRGFTIAMKEVIQRDGEGVWGHESSRGYSPLRTTIARIVADQGVRAKPENVLVTSGSQQALSVIIQTILRAGDTVVVEAPTYDIALKLFRYHRLDIVGCPIDESGMQIDQLREIVRERRPRLIYTVPTYQNPSGTSMTVPRRRALVELASEHNVAVLEDDFVGDVWFEGACEPAVKSFDLDGTVMYAGTFSKILMPGIRVGYLIADGPILDVLAARKYALDLSTSPLMQRTLDRYMTVGRYSAHIRRSRSAYRRRRDMLFEAIQAHLPSGVSCATPTGGIFAWLRLPDGIEAGELIETAAEEGVEIAGGERFFPDPDDGRSFIRVNFAVNPPAILEEGIRRLGRAIERTRTRTRT